jgi:hypothetical protein
MLQQDMDMVPVPSPDIESSMENGVENPVTSERRPES